MYIVGPLAFFNEYCKNLVGGLIVYSYHDNGPYARIVEKVLFIGKARPEKFSDTWYYHGHRHHVLKVQATRHMITLSY